MNSRTLMIALIALMMIVTVSHAAQISGESDCKGPGADALVPVTFVNDQLITALQFDVSYDPAKVTPSPSEPVAGPALADHVISGSVVVPGLYRVLLYSPTNTQLGSGELVSISFSVDSAVTDSSLPLVLPLNGDPGYAGPGALLANVGAVKSLPPSPAPASIHVPQVDVPAPTLTCIGGQAMLQCNSADVPGEPSPSFQWLFEAAPGCEPDVDLGCDVIATTADYTIGVVEPVNEGNFSCVADHGAVCGAVRSDPVLLDVTDNPCAPEALRVYDPGNGGVLVADWNPNPSVNVDKYTLSWGPSSGSYPSSIELPVTGSTTVSLPDGVRQYFVVQASVGPEMSNLSNEATAIPTAGGLDLPQLPEYGYLTPTVADTTHPDLVTYRFPARPGDVTVWYDLYDEDGMPGEVAININGVEVEQPNGSSGNWILGQEVLLPDALVKDDAVNILTFDNLYFNGNPDVEDQWAVRDVSIKLPAPAVGVVPWSMTVDLFTQHVPAEPTLQNCDVYRGTFAEFTPSPANLIGDGVPCGWFRDDQGLNNETPYYYKIQANDTIGNAGAVAGVEPDSIVATPTDQRVTPIGDLHPVRSGADDIELVWSSVVTEGVATEYKFYEGSAASATDYTGVCLPAESTSYIRAGDFSDGIDHYYLMIVVDYFGRESTSYNVLP